MVCSWFGKASKESKRPLRNDEEILAKRNKKRHCSPLGGGYVPLFRFWSNMTLVRDFDRLNRHIRDIDIDPHLAYQSNPYQRDECNRNSLPRWRGWRRRWQQLAKDTKKRNPPKTRQETKFIWPKSVLFVFFRRLFVVVTKSFLFKKENPPKKIFPHHPLRSDIIPTLPPPQCLSRSHLINHFGPRIFGVMALFKNLKKINWH